MFLNIVKTKSGVYYFYNGPRRMSAAELLRRRGVAFVCDINPDAARWLIDYKLTHTADGTPNGCRHCLHCYNAYDFDEDKQAGRRPSARDPHFCELNGQRVRLSRPCHCSEFEIRRH